MFASKSCNFILCTPLTHSTNFLGNSFRQCLRRVCTRKHPTVAHKHWKRFSWEKDENTESNDDVCWQIEEMTIGHPFEKHIPTRSLKAYFKVSSIPCTFGMLPFFNLLDSFNSHCQFVTHKVIVITKRGFSSKTPLKKNFGNLLSKWAVIFYLCLCFLFSLPLKEEVPKVETSFMSRKTFQSLIPISFNST